MPPLLRTLSLKDLLFLFIGSVIGSGIFLTPGLILRRVDGSIGLSLLVWLFGGILSLLGALTYAELAAANPEAGGLYCYIRDGFGRAWAFLYGWSLFLIIASGTIAALAHAFTRYLAEIIPMSPVTSNAVGVTMIAVVTAVNVWGTRKSSDLQNWTTLTKVAMVAILSAVLLSLGHHGADLVPAMGVSQQHEPSILSDFGLAMIAVVTAVNVWGTRKSSDLQNWTTLTKVAMVAILSAVLLSLGHHGADLAPSMSVPQQHGTSVLSNFGLAMIAVLWAYEGWQFGTYSAGEVVKPQKTFPKAFLMGSLFLMILYLVAVLAYLVALGPAAATVSDAIAADSVGVVLGPWAGKIVAIAILISTFSATNSVVLTAPRVFYAMANDNLFFKKLAEVHPRFQTPGYAIVALGVWSAVLACASKFAELASGAIFIGWIFYGLGAAAIFPIRRASKGLPIPYRVPGYPWTPLIFVLVAAAIVGNAVFLALSDPKQFVYLAVAIVIFLLGLPAYYFWRRKQAHP